MVTRTRRSLMFLSYRQLKQRLLEFILRVEHPGRPPYSAVALSPRLRNGPVHFRFLPGYLKSTVIGTTLPKQIKRLGLIPHPRDRPCENIGGTIEGRMRSVGLQNGVLPDKAAYYDLLLLPPWMYSYYYTIA